MRTAIFILLGIVLGVTGARTWGRSHRSRMVELAVDPAYQTIAHSAPVRRESMQRRGVSQRDIRPTDPRYDPVALSEEDDRIMFKDIFENEPRDPAFAPVLEQRIHDTLGNVLRTLQLEDEVRSVRTECRTLSCSTTIQVPRADGRRIFPAINGVLLGDSQMPDLVDTADPAVSEIRIYSINRPMMHDDAYFQRFLEEAVQPALEASKGRLIDRQSDDPQSQVPR